ncbi:MAG: RidA family protein [Acidobacteria bacterium]|nr:RidA family protein [Acidobacteriota bacterium]
MKKIKLPNVPEPKGHYSPAVEHNGLIFVSGQIPVDPETGRVETGSIEAQTELALRNVERILTAAGSDLNHVLQMTIYISEMELWDEVNAVYKRILGDHKPARAIVPVKELHYGTKIEIQAIAAVGTPSS